MKKVLRKECQRTLSAIKKMKKLGSSSIKTKIGRAPKIERNNAGKPIDDYLYNQMCVKVEEIKKVKSDLIKKEQESLRIPINSKTDIILERVKMQVFDELFTSLDSDNDGIISTLKISVTDIPADALVVISPLLAEIEENDHMLKREEFIDACGRLFAVYL